jgi:uncharacterized protein YcfJ
MKPYRYVLATVIIGLSVSGCVTPQGRPDNTATGALTGAAAGAIIGSTARNPGAGAAIGATVGALAGGAIGHSADQAQEAQEARFRAEARQQEQERQTLTTDDVKAMTRAKIGDDLIISQIRSSRTVYHLNTADIVRLKRAGVSEKVIDFMINTPNEIGSAETSVVASTPPPAPLVEPVLVAPGPNYFWVNGRWLWFNGGWAWRHGYWRGGPYHYRYGRHWR